MLNAPVPPALFWLPPLLLGSARLLDAMVLSLLLGLLLGILAPLHRRLGPGLAPAIALMTLGTAAGGLAQLGAEALGLFPLPPALLLLGALSASLLALPGEARRPMFDRAAISWLIAWSALAALREGLGQARSGPACPSARSGKATPRPSCPFFRAAPGRS